MSRLKLSFDGAVQAARRSLRHLRAA